ncbi:MAG: PEP/pyruvate-binding domain-containing protein [Candidatus Eremiobacteraeota bacterium]|nr:PEP/pyruvate-binding domain-containing protein [Candidatus Eremiobacteraeota bacterium]
MFIKEEIEKAQALSEKIGRFPDAEASIRETMRILLDARRIISLDRIKDEALNIFLTNLLVGFEVPSPNRQLLDDAVSQEEVSYWADYYLRKLTDYYFANSFTEHLAELIIEYSRQYDRQYAKIIEEVYMKLKEDMVLEDLYYFSEEVMDDAAPFVMDIKVSLIRQYFSDHLSFIGIAKKYFTLGDLIEMKRNIYGKGKIGGKAAGILLAKRILSLQESPEDQALSQYIQVPEFFVLGSDLCYEFLVHNGLLRYRSFRYTDADLMENQFTRLQKDFRKGRFHPRTRAYFIEILEHLNGAPFVARSSSRLEDAIGFSFAGKYTSVFSPNQGAIESQLEKLEAAVKEIYISMYNPGVIAYRNHNKLLDFEERIAVIIQRINGRLIDETYFFPTLAGVAFSLNPYCWNARIKREDGMLRLVMGFGSRAVDRVGDDYARLVPLSAPTLRPEIEARDIRKYSQKFLDVMNLKENSFQSVRFKDIAPRFDDPQLRFFVSLDEGDHMSDPVGILFDEEKSVLTFSKLLSSTKFTDTMAKILRKLEKHLGGPVDVEFSVEPRLMRGNEDFRVNILQCRRLNFRDELKPARIPQGIPAAKTLFISASGVPNGAILNIEYVVFVDPVGYGALAAFEEKHRVAHLISQLNRTLKEKSFILMGPGRWGSNDVNQGVKVAYGDISNTKMLVEVAYESGGFTPEVSYGTHFFLDLVEGRIVIMPLFPDKEGSYFNRTFLMESPSVLADLLPAYASAADVVKVVHIPSIIKSELLQVKLNAGEVRGIGYISVAESDVLMPEEVVLLPM